MSPESMPARAAWPASWWVPDWPAPAGVRAVCTSREGGRSCGSWAGLNLGDHVGDAPDDVAANRAAVHAALGAQPVFMRQVHGIRAASLHAGSPDDLEADACATAARGVACTIMVADCLPVLLAHRSGRAVAAAHAGWRGLAGGVIESALAALADCVNEPVGTAAGQTLAWLGPCIGPREFEVGGEVKAAFEAHDAAASQAFVPRGNAARVKWLADLPRLARQRLRQAGVPRTWGNDGSDAWCTVRNPSRFFSHRRDRVSGRFAAFVWLE